MDNKYGITNIPPVAKVVKNESKYWGDMVTLFDRLDVSVKLIHMNANTQSSMEYHVHKRESYFILRQGDVYHIEPGLMHMRMALEDTVIIELSTTDDDSDSHIVEDGKTYKFVEN